MAKKKRGGRRKPPTLTTDNSTQSDTSIARARRIKIGWHKLFLSALRADWRVGLAAKAAGMSRAMAYLHKEWFAEFSSAWDEIIENWVDDLDQAAYERCVNGVESDVFGSGGAGAGTVKVGTKTEYSDTLTIFMLKGRRRKIYGDQQKVEHSGTVRTMTPEEEQAAHKSAMAGITSAIRKAALSGLPNLTGVPA